VVDVGQQAGYPDAGHFKTESDAKASK